MSIKPQYPLFSIGWALLTIEEAMGLDLPQAARWPYWGWKISIGPWSLGLAIKAAEILES